MSFISVFDVMGPNMIGPSSSHTAGAARIALLARKLLTGSLKKVEFTLYGSFAKTYHGHGTDRALLGGIMGFATDDVRIRDSFQIATDNGIEYSFIPNNVETDVHPNTVDILMVNEEGQEMTIRGESLGGGKARLCRINGVEVDFYRRIQLDRRCPERCTGRCCLHYQMPQRTWNQYRIHASVPRIQRKYRLYHRRIR